jgi:hypothetical protein
MVGHLWFMIYLLLFMVEGFRGLGSIVYRLVLSVWCQVFGVSGMGLRVWGCAAHLASPPCLGKRLVLRISGLLFIVYCLVFSVWC